MKSKLKTDGEISRLAWHIYQDATPSVRLLAAGRNYICPMQPILEEVPPQATVFDIGCGSGLFLSLLVAQDQCSQIVGCDPNPQALACAKKVATRLLQEQGRSIPTIFLESITPVTWPKTKFSVVTMIDVMHHISPQQQQTFFIEAVEGVAEDGILIYKDMCDSPLWKAAANRLHDLVLARQWINYVPLEQVKQWGKECGLELQKEYFYGRFVYGHEKLIFKKTCTR